MIRTHIRSQTYWLLLLTLGVFSLFVALVWNYTPGIQPSTFVDVIRAKNNKPVQRSFYNLTLAGSGSNLPLTRILLRSFLQKANNKGSKARLHQSIGSTGGVRAVLDQVVDVGLVSRPLKRSEKARPLRLISYARVPVVIAVHRSVPSTSITTQSLLAIYEGKQTHWSNGQRVVVLQREQGDSSHRAIAKVIPLFQKVNDDAYRARRWRVLYQDSQMQQALLSTPGAIGVFDLGAIQTQKLPIKYLRINGASASPEAILGGHYPYHKDLAFVVTNPLKKVPRDFLRFVFSKGGQSIIRQHGYLPLQGRLP